MDIFNDKFYYDRTNYLAVFFFFIKGILGIIINLIRVILDVESI